MLVPVVGPSGAGKDTLLAVARVALAGDGRFVFPRRAITRPAEAGGEEHEALSEAAFAARAAAGGFALRWRAHGLAYGIPRAIEDELLAGRVVVVNLSRTVIAEAAARYPTRLVVVSAPPDLLAARLAGRGREDAADIAQRLAREVALPACVASVEVVNDGDVASGVARLVAALRGCLSLSAGGAR
jgi:phosphonate metabolism protein PhnN/1,5-bisphosphokinase (PRPP-forming)